MKSAKSKLICEIGIFWQIKKNDLINLTINKETATKVVRSVRAEKRNNILVLRLIRSIRAEISNTALVILEKVTTIYVNRIECFHKTKKLPNSLNQK